MNEQSTGFVAGHVTGPEPKSVEFEIDDLPQEFAVLNRGSIVEKIMNHVRKTAHTEVFGLLLGEVIRTPSKKLRTIVSDFIPAQRLQASTFVSVEVSAEELSRMDDEVHQRAASMRDGQLIRVGWFHTHPGHGIFMSGTDRDNHKLYTKPWQVALVLDPIHITYGFFAGPTCTKVKSYSEKDVPHLPSDRLSSVRKGTDSVGKRARLWPSLLWLAGVGLVIYTCQAIVSTMRGKR